MQNFYEVLGIQSNATSMDVERAIRLARQRGDVEEAVLTQARNCLIDPKMRKIYNHKMGIKVAARVRDGSGLKSSMPFWIPVTVLVVLLLGGLGGLHFARQDTAEKKQEAKERAHMAQMQQAEAQEGIVRSAQPKAGVWESSHLMYAPTPQYMQASTQLQNEFSMFKQAKLVLSVPEGESAQLLVVLDQNIFCQNDCRIQLVFDEYNRFALPSQAQGNYLAAAMSDSVLSSFERDGKVTVILPDQDQSTFVFEYKALKP